MKNLNPLYEYNYLLAPTFGADDAINIGSTDAIKNAARTASGWAIGIGTKYAKDTRLVKRIMAQYPDPMQFKARLAQLPVTSFNKNVLLAKLQPGISESDYAKLLRRYVCHGTLGRYFWHGWGHVYSGLGNAIDALSNETSDVDSAIANNL